MVDRSIDELIPWDGGDLIDSLAVLARLCSRQRPAIKDLLEACDLLRASLQASEAYVIRGGDPHCLKIADSSDPTQYEIKQKGYWLTWSQLAESGLEDAVMLQVENRIVMSGTILRPAFACTHVAAILTGYESNSDMVIVRGPWPEGLTADQVGYLSIGRTMLSQLVANVLDSERIKRQQHQFEAVAAVAKAFNEASENEDVLTSVATALAKASGMDWVTITLEDGEGHITERANNIARHAEADAGRSLVENRGIWSDTGEATLKYREKTREGRPWIIPDVFDPTIGFGAEVLAYYQRSHILCSAAHPVIFHGEALGRVTFCATTRWSFDESELAMLNALAVQAATTIQGLRLYSDLDRSREELREYAARLEESSRAEHFLARTDALTSMPNRRLIEEVMAAECARASRYEQPMSVMISDLDQFKTINDTYGHLAGDELLKLVASLARRTCRAADLVGRWGGDEFVFVLPSTPLEEARVLGDRFSEMLASADLGGAGLDGKARVTISSGIAEVGTETYGDSLLLLEQADKALYIAKEGGRNRVELFRSQQAAA